jgi:hypothetical protein
MVLEFTHVNDRIKESTAVKPRIGLDLQIRFFGDLLLMKEILETDDTASFLGRSPGAMQLGHGGNYLSKSGRPSLVFLRDEIEK